MKRKYRALVLAAGLGTRLKPYTNYVPKCLIEIGKKPLISYWLDKLSKLECDSVLVNTHYKSEQVQNYISSLNYENMYIKTTYEKNLLGTARTLLKNIDFFNNCLLTSLHKGQPKKAQTGGKRNKPATYSKGRGGKKKTKVQGPNASKMHSISSSKK